MTKYEALFKATKDNLQEVARMKYGLADEIKKEYWVGYIQALNDCERIIELGVDRQEATVCR